jgi:sirohydrochlorin cobaltochelatase
MKKMILLAMHGVPPLDFPSSELGEFFRLHAFAESGLRGVRDFPEQRYGDLEKKIRRWPRTRENDPFFTTSEKLARKLGEETGMEVVPGFIEFCAPDLDDAFREIIGRGATRIIVVTPMMTLGGQHAERDIPEAISRAVKAYPAVRIDYAWPFPLDEIVGFLARQTARMDT